MKWNDRLRIARDEADKTDTDIARACDVANSTVHGWMSGNTINIEARHLIPACKLLGVSPFWIMLGEEPPGNEIMLSTSTSVPAFEIIRLISLYAQASTDGRQFIMRAGETAAKSSPST